MYEFLKIKYNTWYQGLRFNLSAKNSPLFIGSYKYFYWPSKGSLNDFLNQYSLSKKDSFTVIQAGANDGITHDPIHKFIKRDRWKGVLLEPQSYVYNTFLTKLYKENKNIHTICAAVGEKDGHQKLYKIGFSNLHWADGLASFSYEKVKEAFDSGLVKTNCERYNIVMPSSPSEQIVAEEVVVISPSTMLERYQLSEIDLLQIDTEGFDYQVVRIFIEANIKPKAIIFENIHLSDEDKDASKELLASNDYATKKFGANTLAMQRPLGNFSSFFNED